VWGNVGSMTKRVAVSICLVLLSLATALLGAGCGSSAIDPVASAATTSNAAPGFRMDISMRMDMSGLPQGQNVAITATGEGVMDTRDRAGAMNLTMQLPNLPSVTGALGGASSITLKYLIHGRVIYMHVPAALVSKVPGARPWVKLDLSKLASNMGLGGLPSLNNPTLEDPSQMLSYLRGVSGHVTTVGTDTVAGVKTTHYRASIDLNRVADEAPPSDRATARSSIQRLEALTHLTSIPVDLWIDGQHFVRRMTMNLKLSVLGTIGMHMNLQVTMPEYGPQPVPAFPPASQVTDLSSMMGAGGSAGSSGSLFG